MSWLKRLNDWWTKNILHHGEPEDLSDRTGWSERELSDMLDRGFTDEELQKYRDNTSGPISRYVTDTKDGRQLMQDRNGWYSKWAKRWLSAVGLGLGSTFFDGSSSPFRILGDSQSAQQGNSNIYSSFVNAFGNLFNGLSGSLGGLTSQLGSSWLNMKNMEKLIDKQNEYNTPANQMQRFADAGLNPNLVYGLGSNGNQPASGSVAPVDFDTSQRENRLAKMQIETQSALANSEIAERQSRVNLNNEQANAQKMANDVYMEGWTNQQNLILKQIETQIEETRKRRAEADTEEARALYSKDIERLEFEKSQKEKEILDQQAKWAEANEITSVIGNVFRIGFGANVGYTRSRSNSSISK